MTPSQFEEYVSEVFKDKGYSIKLTPNTGDWGVDIFALKGDEKIAIQAKMYGGTTRRINRQCVMEAHGAKDYFDCTKAIIATDGKLLSDAIEVAAKLKIDVLYVDVSKIICKSFKEDVGQKQDEYSEQNFDDIWAKHIIPLQGKELRKGNGETNTIVKADWSGIERITSNGNKGKIKIEIFKQTVNHLLSKGNITRDEINQNYLGRASSGVVLILSQVPFFHLTSNPSGLVFKDK